MQRLAAATAILLSAVAAEAAEPFAADEVYGTEAGCNWIETRTFPGSEDTLVVTRDFMRGYESMCHFVDAKVGAHEDLFVSAICYGEGEIWPATYAMMIDPDSGALVMSSVGGVGAGDKLQVCEGVTTELANRVVGE